jgi:teichoic acid transport system permease protein
VSGADTPTTVAAAGPGRDDLIDVSARVPLRTYLRELSDRREYIFRVPLDDLRAENYDTVLGNIWHLLNPTLLVGVYYLVFGVILGTDRGVDNFLTFLAAGVFTYQFIQRSGIQGSKSITSNEGLIRSLRFPRAILPISTVLGEALSYLPALTILYVVALATGVSPHPAWLLIPLLILPAQFVFNLGLAFLTARLSDAVRDVENLLPFIFRITFYLSGILYSVEERVESAELRHLFTFNPVYCYATLVRGSIFHEAVNPALVLSAAGWTVALFVVGFVLFRSAEHTYGRT